VPADGLGLIQGVFGFWESLPYRGQDRKRLLFIPGAPRPNFSLLFRKRRLTNRFYLSAPEVFFPPLTLLKQ